MGIKGNMKDVMLKVAIAEHELDGAENKQDLKGKNKICFQLAISNGKTVFTTGQAIKL